jgi:hypothetical protein
VGLSAQERAERLAENRLVAGGLVCVGLIGAPPGERVSSKYDGVARADVGGRSQGQALSGESMLEVRAMIQVFD